MARPRYYLRKYIIERELSRMRAGRILEIGAGAGDLLASLAGKGYDVCGIDYSEPAVRHVREKYPGLDVCAVSDEDFACTGKKFSVVIACEVLEHIADDGAALARWRRFLEPGGALILSVPAHQRMWEAHDDMHGHLRRYSRQELLRKMHRAGYRDCSVMCYGFPLANIARFAARFVIRHRADDTLSQDEKTRLSGIDYPRFAASRFVNSVSVYPFALIQLCFLRCDLGPGFVCRGISMG